MSIGLIVTRGFGNGTLVGTIKDLTTAGYDIAEVSISIGFHQGEVVVFSAYDGVVDAGNAYTGKVATFNAIDIT